MGESGTEGPGVDQRRLHEDLALLVLPPASSAMVVRQWANVASRSGSEQGALGGNADAAREPLVDRGLHEQLLDRATVSMLERTSP